MGLTPMPILIRITVSSSHDYEFTDREIWVSSNGECRWIKTQILLDRHRSWSFLRLGIGLEMCVCARVCVRERPITRNHCGTWLRLQLKYIVALGWSEQKQKSLGEMWIRFRIIHEASGKKFGPSTRNLGLGEMCTIS